MIQSYRLQLKDDYMPYRYIITGGEWFTAEESSGVAIVYPEHDLLWISYHIEMTQRFKTLENFEKEFNALPRWEATRYAVDERARDVDEDLRVLSVDLFLFDCRTGQPLLDQHGAVAGREAELGRLCRAFKQLMRGEDFSLL